MRLLLGNEECRPGLHETACLSPPAPMHVAPSSVCGINHTIIDISPIIPPIIRKQNRFPTRSKENKSHNKNHNLRSTIQSRTKHIVELEEPIRLIPSQIKLAPESYNEETYDGRIDAGDEPADVPGDDGDIELVEPDFGEEAMKGVDWKRCGESDYEAQWHPLVGAAPRVHMFG